MAVCAAPCAFDAAGVLLMGTALLLPLLYRFKEVGVSYSGGVCYSPCGYFTVGALCAHTLSVSGDAVGDGVGNPGFFG